MLVATDLQYSILRVVPSLERGERINVGVVLFPQQLALLFPSLDPAAVIGHLRALCDVAEGLLPGTGLLGSLTASERFGWLASPSSTVIQPSPVHTGLTSDPAATLNRLLANLVGPPPGS